MNLSALREMFEDYDDIPSGYWTELQYLKMDKRFCEVMAIAHPELVPPVAAVDSAA